LGREGGGEKEEKDKPPPISPWGGFVAIFRKFIHDFFDFLFSNAFIVIHVILWLMPVF
jgi:hypothetical protein